MTELHSVGGLTIKNCKEISTRHFAKRQLTWFRRERQVTWIQKEKYDYDEEKILEAMISHLEGKIC